MKLILGTMTFGQQVELSEAMEIIKGFLDEGHYELDTAYVYNEGNSEKILGQVISKIGREKIILATKVNPRVTGKLDRNAVLMQYNESADRLKTEYIDTLYLHFPDHNTRVEEALEVCNELYEQGKIKELGLSNFPAWLVVDAWHKCSANHWLLPTVYEGLYNALSRGAERELFVALKILGIRYNAYNPLAGGLLSGKYSSFDDKPSEGRFTYRPNYQNRYWKESYFNALSIVKARCDICGISLAESAIRWLVYHSYLSEKRNDGIILGVSRAEQLRQNINAAGRGPLPENIVDAYEEAWRNCRPDAPEYFRFYGIKGEEKC